MIVRNNAQGRDCESKDSCSILTKPKEVTNLSLENKIAKNLNAIKMLKLRGIVELKNYLMD